MTMKFNVPKCRKTNTGFTLIEILVVIAIISIIAAILFPVFARARENAWRTNCLSNLKQIGLGIIQYTQDFDEHLPLLVSQRGTGNAALYTWPNLVQPYMKSEQIFVCPSSIQAGGYGATPDNDLNQYYPSYGLNTKMSTATNNSEQFKIGISLATINHPADLLMTVENAIIRPALTDRKRGYVYAWYYCGSTLPGGTPELGNLEANCSPPYAQHFDGANVLFADGHAKYRLRNTIIYRPSDVTMANWRLWQPTAS